MHIYWSSWSHIGHHILYVCDTQRTNRKSRCVAKPIRQKNSIDIDNRHRCILTNIVMGVSTILIVGRLRLISCQCYSHRRLLVFSQTRLFSSIRLWYLVRHQTDADHAITPNFVVIKSDDVCAIVEINCTFHEQQLLSAPVLHVLIVQSPISNSMYNYRDPVSNEFPIGFVLICYILLSTPVMNHFQEAYVLLRHKKRSSSRSAVISLYLRLQGHLGLS